MTRLEGDNPESFLLQVRRGCWIARFHMTFKAGTRLTVSMMDKLDACKDDAARRLLLGRSR